MLNQYKNVLNDMPHKEAAKKVVSLIEYTYEKAEFTQSHRNPVELAFLSLVFKYRFDIKKNFITIFYDASNKLYQVLRGSPLLLNQTYLVENTLTEAQLLSLAQAYDLHLHCGTLAKDDGPKSKGEVYLNFHNASDFNAACSALDNSMPGSYTLTNLPCQMEIKEPLITLINRCRNLELSEQTSGAKLK